MTHAGRIHYDANQGTTSHLIMGECAHRKRITIYAPSAGVVTITNSPVAAADQGITLAAGMSPLYFDVDFHGDCVLREWYVIYTAGGKAIAWVETLCFGDDKDAHNHDSSASKRR